MRMLNSASAGLNLCSRLQRAQTPELMSHFAKKSGDFGLGVRRGDSEKSGREYSEAALGEREVGGEKRVTGRCVGG